MDERTMTGSEQRLHARLADRAVIELSGPDLKDFLQGLVTVDISALSEKKSLWGALLTPQGRILFTFTLAAPEPDTLLLETEAERAEELCQRLLLYRLRKKVTIRPAEGSWQVVVFPGASPQAFDLAPEPGASRKIPEGMLLVDPRLAELGVRALLRSEQAEAALSRLESAETDPAAYHRLRLLFGVAEQSAEIPPGRCLPLEYNFDRLHAVDFRKGCFIGQEVTARMHFRSATKRRLLPVQLAAPLTPPKPVVCARGREIGELRAALAQTGLALLRLDALTDPAALPLQADTTELAPSWPLWLRPDRPGS